MAGASSAGARLRRRDPKTDEQKEDLGIILAATLTLLALVIGFSVSMASNRYDQRKNFEKANAIGTEMLRAGLLPPADAAKVRGLLGAYLDQRILFYINQDGARRTQIDRSPASCKPTSEPRSASRAAHSQRRSQPWCSPA